MPGEWQRPRQPQPRAGAQAAGGAHAWAAGGGGVSRSPSPPQGCPQGGGCSRCPIAWPQGLPVWRAGGTQPPGALACLATRPPVPLLPRCRGAGDGLTLICNRWEPHCSGAVYCIRGTLSSNQLSGRPSPDLIPTLARLWDCSALAWGDWQGRTPRALSFTKSLLLGGGASACLSGAGLAFDSPGNPAGGQRGPAALGTPVPSPRRGTAFCVGVHVGEEEPGLVQVRVCGSSSQPPSPAASPGSRPAPRSRSGAEPAPGPRAAMQSAVAAATSPPASAGQGMCVGPSPTAWLLPVASCALQKEREVGLALSALRREALGSSLDQCKEASGLSRNSSQAVQAEGCSPSPGMCLCCVEMLQVRARLIVYGTQPASASPTLLPLASY